jgi:hypothetical protein
LNIPNSKPVKYGDSGTFELKWRKWLDAFNGQTRRDVRDPLQLLLPGHVEKLLAWLELQLIHVIPEALSKLPDSTINGHVRQWTRLHSVTIFGPAKSVI